MKVLQDLWILTNSGIVLFKHVFEKHMKTQLFGALLTALNSFAEKLSDGGLSNFELSNKRFIILKKNNFLYVANSSKSIKERKVIQQLKKVSERFLKKYPVEWFKNEWDNNVSIFSNFEKEIEDLLEDSVKKFWRDF